MRTDADEAYEVSLKAELIVVCLISDDIVHILNSRMSFGRSLQYGGMLS